MRPPGTIFMAATAFALSAAPAPAQTPRPLSVDLGRLMDGKSAQISNRTLTVRKEDGRTVARLDARAAEGGALLTGIQLGDGVIELDLRGRDVAQQSFVGIAFHFVDWTTYDAVYFRPFNFRAAEAERRGHSVQYVSHPLNTWQKLRAERPGQFERAIEPPPDPNGWFHARIVLANSKVEVYVNRAGPPCLVVDDLGKHKFGGVALFVGNGSDGAFADLRVSADSRRDTTMKIKLNSVIVRDQASALRFYTEVLGFMKKTDVPAGEFRWLTVVSPEEPDGTELVLEPNVNAAAAAYQRALFDAGIPLTAFAVEDVEQEYLRLSALGVTFTSKPVDAGAAIIAVLDDTCGNLIQIYQIR
jgi:catechol 2,3-dioxygenase-like lactoylglutathione lyase family enzyme